MEKIVNDTITEMEFGDLPMDSADAISFLEAHTDYKAQIIACQEKIQKLENEGESILRTPRVLYDEVGSCVKTLTQMKKSLDASWNYRLNQLTQHRDIQIFTEKAKQIETWFASKEAFLANKDVGDSMSSVEALLRKHENFEKSCLAYCDKIQELEPLATDLGRHEDCKEIESWFDNISQRRDRLLESSEERKKVLMDSKSLQQLLLEIYEISNWMNEKIQVVSEDPYRDLKNLSSKTQKHATLEAEILSNHSRVVSITTQADELQSQGHFASEQILQHIQNLEDMWQKLMDATNEQKIKLNEAFNALQLEQKLEDINNLLNDTETQLNINDYVYDVVAIEQEIDNLQDLEKDLEEIGQKINILNDASQTFDHSSKEEILSKLKHTTERYRTLEDSIEQKYTKLQEDLAFASLEKDVNDEMSWIEDNIAICRSEEYFNDVISVQVLQKKLQALETEMVSREPLVNSIVERGFRMSNPSAEIKVKLLETRFRELEDSVSLRRLRLSDALEAQTYYFEVAQAEIWIKGKMAQIQSCEPALDVYSAQEVKKKITTIEAASNAFKNNIASLEDFCCNLEGRGHFDAHNIRMKQEDLNTRYEELTCSILKKIAILREEEEYFIFQRDTNTVISQLKSMSNVGNNPEVVRDAEHVESLLQKLMLFRNKMRSYEENVKELQQRATTLIEGGHTESSEIQQLLTDLEDTWLECDFSAENRYKNLEQAKIIHSFNKSADETISWIYEKDVAFSSENFGHDLQSIQTLLKHHETLEGDLKAIQDQIEALKEEGKNLASQFADSENSLEEKLNVVKEAWEKCSRNATDRKQKLLQAEQIQSYFDELKDFHAWIKEISALITTTDLPEDVAGCDALLAQHDGYKSDIDSQVRSFRNFEVRGQEIINSGHFMADEIKQKLTTLNSSFDDLLCLWEERRKIHEQNLDLQLYKKKLKELDTWLQGQEHYLAQEDGRSLSEIDYLISKHEQFEKKLCLYESKFQELLKKTLVEEEIMRKREKEEKRRLEEEKLSEQRKFEELKKQEEEKLLKERRRERSETETLSKDDSDDDLYFHDDRPPKEQVFKRIGSRRSSQGPAQELSRPETPVILRKKYNAPKSVPPTTAEGYLDRKQELLSGGKRSTNRAWKTCYTVLCGQLICFFKDKKAFLHQNAAKPPLSILGAKCTIPKDYHKKKNVFRLQPTDNSSFLFEAANQIKRDEWIQKINFTASLPPSMQLISAFEKQSDLINKKDHAKPIGAYKVRKLTAASDYEEPKVPEDPKRHGQSDHGSNSAHEISLNLSNRSSTITSCEDEDLQSARSSFSDQSSYKTALASASSISTLQNEYNTDSSEEEDRLTYSLPEPVTRTKSELSVTTPRGKVTKHMSLPRETTPKKSEGKTFWKGFSLKRNR